MTEFIVKDTSRGNERECESRSEAQETRDDMVSLGADPSDLVIESVGADGGTTETEVVEETTQIETAEHDNRPTEPPATDTEPVQEPDTIDPEELSKNPIEFLEGVNDSFVNYIRGTPAISKRGFRFIQREFEISTQSEVVEWSEDPLGCVVWAKAELPGGYSAEAHGEGYQFESDVSDNEFVRYADTRAKNRALSDLTSAGALAVSELKGGE